MYHIEEKAIFSKSIPVLFNLTVNKGVHIPGYYLYIKRDYMTIVI